MESIFIKVINKKKMKKEIWEIVKKLVDRLVMENEVMENILREQNNELEKLKKDFDQFTN